MPDAGTPASGPDVADAGIPATEMPESRQAEHRNPGSRNAGNPAANHPKASPFNPPRATPAPASPPPTSGEESHDAPLGGQTPEVNPEGWSQSHFVGYYWYVVSWYRNERQLPLSLPDFGRLASEISRFLQTKSKTQLWTHIRELVGYFDVVRYQLRHSTTVTVALNELTLNNTICAEKILAFNHLPPDERQNLLQQANEWAAPDETEAA